VDGLDGDYYTGNSLELQNGGKKRDPSDGHQNASSSSPETKRRRSKKLDEFAIVVVSERQGNWHPNTQYGTIKDIWNEVPAGILSELNVAKVENLHSQRQSPSIVYQETPSRSKLH
jgi:hypothetical protein